MDEKLTTEQRDGVLGCRVIARSPWAHVVGRMMLIIDQLTEALAAERANHEKTAKFGAAQLERTEAAEALVLELEAELSRQVDYHCKQVANCARVFDAGEQHLAAANALLRQVHAEQAPTVSLLCAIGDHLSAQPAATPDHDRAVLEALDKCSAWRDGHGIPHVNDTREFAEAELARREAKRG